MPTPPFPLRLSEYTFFAQIAGSPLPRRLPEILCRNLEFTWQANLCAAGNRRNLIPSVKKNCKFDMRLAINGHWIRKMPVAHARD
jgi:hypothetical protein